MGFHLAMSFRSLAARLMGRFNDRRHMDTDTTPAMGFAPSQTIASRLRRPALSPCSRRRESSGVAADETALSSAFIAGGNLINNN